MRMLGLRTPSSAPIVQNCAVANAAQALADSQIVSTNTAIVPVVVPTDIPSSTDVVVMDNGSTVVVSPAAQVAPPPEAPSLGTRVLTALDRPVVLGAIAVTVAVGTYLTLSMMGSKKGGGAAASRGASGKRSASRKRRSKRGSKRRAA